MLWIVSAPACIPPRIKILKKNVDAEIYKMHLLSLSIENARKLAAFLVTPR